MTEITPTKTKSLIKSIGAKSTFKSGKRHNNPKSDKPVELLGDGNYGNSPVDNSTVSGE